MSASEVRPRSADGRTLERHEAAEAFIRENGWRRTYGGGCEVGLIVGGRLYKAIDGWHGEDEAVRRLASQLVAATSLPYGAKRLAVREDKARRAM